MRAELQWPAQAAPRPVVIDTNIALDLLVFADPACAALLQLLAGERLHWIATQAMHDELASVLRYPQLQPWLQRHALMDAQVLQAWRARVELLPDAPPAPMRCKDGDDQKFIDLAVAHQAALLSKDKAVLRLRNRLRTAGVATGSQLVLLQAT